MSVDVPIILALDYSACFSPKAESERLYSGGQLRVRTSVGRPALVALGPGGTLVGGVLQNLP